MITKDYSLIMENFLIFSCSNRVDFFYPPIINSRLGKSFFLRCGKLPSGRGYLDVSMRRGLWLFLLWRPGFGAPRHRRRNSPRRTMRTGAWPRRRSTATEAINLCRWCAAGTGAAAIPHTVDRAVRSAFGGPMLRRGKQGIKTAANQLAHAGTGP
jgi:hypothetical protein